MIVAEKKSAPRRAERSRAELGGRCSVVGDGIASDGLPKAPTGAPTSTETEEKPTKTRVTEEENSRQCERRIIVQIYLKVAEFSRKPLEEKKRKAQPASQQQF
ncbi:hypothetical protein ATANTOWER_015430 [Ataeniobius toweri]|uniref:Uncharacterized protein n=1 Tax=Ataeniobius toweri TaxID=208326 RepID=A0ABU7CA10_9TELE|nr:hypothetical protein [Ataeniobius toweri]